MNNTTDQQQKQYADANNLNDLWKGAIAKFAEKVVVETLQRIIRTDDVEGVLHAILDAESNILSYVDTSGCFHFCVGASTEGDLEVGGDASVEGRVLMENCKVVGSGYESGMFYILDADNHQLSGRGGLQRHPYRHTGRTRRSGRAPEGRGRLETTFSIHTINSILL